MCQLIRPPDNHTTCTKSDILRTYIHHIPRLLTTYYLLLTTTTYHHDHQSHPCLHCLGCPKPRSLPHLSISLSLPHRLRFSSHRSLTSSYLLILDNFISRLTGPWTSLSQLDGALSGINSRHHQPNAPSPAQRTWSGLITNRTPSWSPLSPSLFFPYLLN